MPSTTEKGATYKNKDTSDLNGVNGNEKAEKPDESQSDIVEQRNTLADVQTTENTNVFSSNPPSSNVVNEEGADLTKTADRYGISRPEDRYNGPNVQQNFVDKVPTGIPLPFVDATYDQIEPGKPVGNEEDMTARNWLGIEALCLHPPNGRRKAQGPGTYSVKRRKKH